LPCSDPAERAVKMAMAMAMREAAGKLITAWRRRHGSELGFGIGIAQDYALLGQIGISERSGYTAIGTVCSLAARLCADWRGRSIAKFEDLGNLELKGLGRPVAAFNVAGPVSPHFSYRCDFWAAMSQGCD
jgi:adenylate cyclase